MVLFPFPLAIVLAAGIPLEWWWPYLLTFVSWVAFVLFIDHVAAHRWPVRLQFFASRGIKWPHLGFGFVCIGLLLALFLLSRMRVVSNPVLEWSAWNVIVAVVLVESAIVASRKTIATRTSTKDTSE